MKSTSLGRSWCFQNLVIERRVCQWRRGSRGSYSIQRGRRNAMTLCSQFFDLVALFRTKFVESLVYFGFKHANMMSTRLDKLACGFLEVRKVLLNEFGNRTQATLQDRLSVPFTGLVNAVQIAFYGRRMDVLRII